MSNRKTPYHNGAGDSEFLAELKLISFLKDNRHLIERHRVPDIKVSEANSSYRTINHWESLKILNDNRENKGWRKFSTFDLLWIEIVKHLRKWNIKTEVILKVKNRLFEDIGLERTFLDREEDKKLDILWIEKALFKTMIAKDYNMYLIVFESGESYVTTQAEINRNMRFGVIPEGYLLINLNKLWSKVITKIQVNSENQFALDGDEIKLLAILRTEDSDVKVKKSKDGKIAFIERTFKGAKQDLGDLNSIIGNIEFGEATLKIQNGKVSFIEAVNKEKIKK